LGKKRIRKNGKIIPNMEVKFIKDRFDKYVLDNKIEVKMGKHKLFQHMNLLILLSKTISKYNGGIVNIFD
jgi:hypothetical protein